MFEIFGAVLLAGVIVALAATGVVATIFAVVAVVCVVLAVICMFLGAAFVLVFRIAVAVLVALVLKWLYSRVLAFLGERGALTALRDASLVNRVSWILAAATTGYLYFLRCGAGGASDYSPTGTRRGAIRVDGSPSRSRVLQRPAARGRLRLAAACAGRALLLAARRGCRFVPRTPCPFSSRQTKNACRGRR